MDISFKSDVTTEIPEFPEDLLKIIKNNIRIEELSDEQINQLSELMISWIEIMQKELNIIKGMEEGQIQKCVITEYKFWNTRNKNFKIILQQLSNNKLMEQYIKMMENICEHNQMVVVNTLKHFYSTKNKFEITYKSTVEQTKDNIELIYEGIYAIAVAPLSVIIENSTSLYNNLNLMWLMSRFYTEKKNMERLLESISNLIADRISSTLSVPDIFRYETSEALLLTKSALIIVDDWKDKYYSQCQMNIQKISEKYRKSWAWLFDENIIFSKLNFVGLVVKELAKIIEIVHEFNSIYPHFIIIGDMYSIDKTNVYNKQLWNDTINKFKYCIVNNLYSKISPIMDTTQSAIKGLKALKLMEKYMIMQEDLHDSKYSIVFEQLTVEINFFHTQFKSFKSSPQLLIDVPSVAGNIILMHDLYLRAKDIVQGIESVTQVPSIQLKNILSDYEHFCKEVLIHENKIFNEWLCDALKIQTYSIQKALLVFCDTTLVMGFNKKLFCVMDTARQLNILNYDLPDVIMNLIEKREEIFNNIENMNKLVKMYNKILNEMDASIVLAMDHHLASIKYSLQPCLVKRYSYLSNQLPEFINKIIVSLNEYNIIYDHVKSYEKIIYEKLMLIENVEFFSMYCNNGYCQEFMKMIDESNIQRNKNFLEIRRTLNYIYKAVNLIEKVCYNDEMSQNHMQMKLLYAKYENALSEAFIIMVLNNLKAFKMILNYNCAIFVIHTIHVEKYTLNLDVETIVTLFTKAISDMVNELKFVKLPSWLKNIEIKSPLGQIEKNCDLKLHLFYNCVVTNICVSDMEKECLDSIKHIGDQLTRKIQKLQIFGFLFSKQDKWIINQFVATNPTLNDYNEKLSSFDNISKCFENHPHVDVGIFQLDNSEYNIIIKERCKFWHSIFGKQLIFECEKMITTFMNKIMILKSQLKSHFRNTQEITIVENTIKEIKGTISHADLTIQEINNYFNFLRKHLIIIPGNQLKQFEQLKTNWHDLYNEALKKNFSIEDAKKILVTETSI